ncbi:AraC family transcriptional regulator [Leptospira borgpetersenii]|uniref:AraC family transcriptional regulator n=1 Tax=Leptospira borgpetersenii TaxID=174 RepID=UPI001BCCECFD|nr:helix-turn-helix domain-containing protein [Leptospira borgpetersenii]QVK50596.1 helix-turn-helix transcriptional regulator [Leptospira borgpetersenii]QVK63346.1 helix-turn-helix transcriptional regulator [Leptospira borgpetersenii]QVK66726.1 helix-turn-helix transcriptional regulator [Leptospira borgpetersenii]
MEEIEYYSLAATLYFMIAVFGILKSNRQKNIVVPVLFFLMACTFWSFTATIFISENTLAKKLAQYFYTYFSIAVVFLFISFATSAKNDNFRYIYTNFTVLRRLFLHSFASTAAIVVLWDLLGEFKIPNLSEVVSLGIFLFFICLLFHVLIFLRSAKNKKALIKILPCISLLLVIKLTEMFRHFEGIKIIEPINKINYYFLILSPIILSECISILSNIQRTQNELLLVSDSPEERISNQNISRRDSVQDKKSLLEDLNIEKVESKLTELMQSEKIHLDEDLRLPSLASEMGLSVHHLSAFLNEHMGMNFNSFINHHRVKEAEVMLLDEPDRSILSIGMAVGFSSSSAFHRAFLKEVKKSPKAFREENLPNYKSKEDKMGNLSSSTRYSHSI